MKSSPPLGERTAARLPASPASHSPVDSSDGAAGGAPGRPDEIEEAGNRWLVHPLSRRLVDRLIATRVTPNQVSVASVFAAAAGAAAYLWLAWPWSALGGLAGFFSWHVLDGADGDLARRSGRASTSGELVDGVCDHVSQALLYLAFAAVLQRGLGAGAWALAALAGASHFVQSNAYETGRKSYRHWVYGAAWMRQSGAALAAMGPVRRALARLYLGLSALSNPGEARIDAAMAGAEVTPAARRRYRLAFAPLVKASAVLSGNTRTLAAFVSVLIGSPLWFFLFEIVGLNPALVIVLAWRAKRAKAFCAELAAAAAADGQAAWAPN